ncbi:MAG: class I SAM-dependent DNA methyltransferase [Thermoflexales bacterium]
MPRSSVHRLPSSWEARELLREKGQFWTPDWVAEAMVEYALAGRGEMLFDPAVGAGAFFRAAKALARERGFTVRLSGMEIDPNALSAALAHGLEPQDIAAVALGDFVLQPPMATFQAIVANPPYIRHHRLDPERKAQLRRLAVQIVGKPLDGRAGLHVYFLLRALSLLAKDGRLAFIMPADTCEGRFAPDLWAWIASNFALDAVITFAPEATPFPNVDTNPLIFFIRKARPRPQLLWVKCRRPATDALKTWVRSGLRDAANQDLLVIARDLAEALATGLSREPLDRPSGRYVLGDFVKVMRGIATGANDFFFMTVERARELQIPDAYLVRAVGRTRDIPGDQITLETLAMLQRKGRPTLLLSLGGEDKQALPEAVRRYLGEGENAGLPQRPLIAQRKPWYKMEVRVPPPFLFAYLGRRHSRFIRNVAQVVPLTGFLCVYPRYGRGERHLDQLWKILSHPDTAANLSQIGKSYGDGAIKVEPRLLERLPIPDHVLRQCDVLTQMRLLEAPRRGYMATNGDADASE